MADKNQYFILTSAIESEPDFFVSTAVTSCLPQTSETMNSGSESKLTVSPEKQHRLIFFIYKYSQTRL